MTQIYVSIGNSDNKLTQMEWSEFCRDLVRTLDGFSLRTYGQWYSRPDSPWQNMVASVEVPDDLQGLRVTLAKLARTYRQDSIALQEGTAELITREWAY